MPNAVLLASRGKKLATITVRTAPDFKRVLQRHVESQGSDLSKHLLHLAVMELCEQENDGVTSCNELAELRQALDLASQESDLTAPLKLHVLTKLTKFQARLLGARTLKDWSDRRSA